MEEIPERITLCYLEVVLMPNGEIICLGKSIGWFNVLKSHLTPVKEKENETKPS